jgi:NADH dehydrogenase (ubiquinone) Fe-S protein 1
MNQKFIKIFINDIAVYVKPQTTILQACEKINIYIPRFCYHNQLSVAGNCRMCLVEVEKSPKPVVSCAFPVMNNMKIYTNTPLVKKSKENILEFLLLNHPLDCPICDQGGECDLQDQSLLYGSDKSRFYEYKRGVEDKNCGPLIKTIMTRCIHCTRCVRFINEMTSFKNLGTTNRSSKVEIGTYFERYLNTEVSGNIIDLCPVGALTSKPYAFIARPWELKSTNTIDVMDGVCSNIKVDTRGLNILRILPRLNKNINEDWISDKTRFFFDGLKYQRLLNVWSKSKLNKNKFLKSFFLNDLVSLKSTSKQFHKFYYPLPRKKVGILIGKTLDIETAVSIKKFSKFFNIDNIINVSIKKNTQSDLLENCQFTTSLSSIENTDLCLIIGSNPRLEASSYNLKILSQVKKNNLKVYHIGSNNDFTYFSNHLGTNLEVLLKIVEGKHFLCKILKNSKNPLIIYGDSILNRKDFSSFILKNIFNSLKLKFSNIQLLNTDVSNMTTLNLNLKPGKNSLFKYNLRNNNEFHENIDFLYCIGTSKVPKNVNTAKTIIYQGTHCNIDIKKNSSLLIPSKSVFEQTSTFCNIEGRVQKSPKLINNMKIKKDFSLFNFVTSLIFNQYFNFNKNIGQLNKLKLFFVSPNLIFNNKLVNTNFNHSKINKLVFKEKYLVKNPLKSTILNFYKTNIITENSVTMSKCSKMIFQEHNFK